MTAVTALLTNKAYGYPTRGAPRRRKPTVLACLHQTSNATATAIGERLDAGARAAVVRPSRTPTAAEARAYLEELPVLWAKTSDAGRHAIAEAVFERIEVLGVTDYTFTLTAHTNARGWDAAFGAGVVRVKEGQSGRGERRQATLRHLNVPVPLPLHIEVTGTERWVRGSIA